MTFYTAIGSYQIKNEGDRRMPYILRMGRLEPVSIPEFLVWSRLVWEVETYDALKESYAEQTSRIGIKLPELDPTLKMLERRRLIARGIGYTGEDALYDLLAEAFVLPVRTLGGKRLSAVIRLLAGGKITLQEASRIMKPDRLTADERRIVNLVDQTPLSVSELIRCFDNGVTDVSTPDKVIDGLYAEDENQERMRIVTQHSDNRRKVLQAAANLYLRHKVVLDLI